MVSDASLVARSVWSSEGKGYHAAGSDHLADKSSRSPACSWVKVRREVPSAARSTDVVYPLNFSRTNATGGEVIRQPRHPTSDRLLYGAG